MIAISHPQLISAFDIPIRIRVGSGKVAPIELKTFSNLGMIHTSAATTANTPKIRTITG